MRLPQSMLAITLALAALAGCTSEPNRLPDLVQEFTPEQTVALIHIADNGGPPVTLGPVLAQGSDLWLTGACLGGGLMTLQVIAPAGGHRRERDSITGDCNGERMLGVNFYTARYDGDATPEVFCIRPSFEGEVTAWEVFVGQSKEVTVPTEIQPTPSPVGSASPATANC